MSCNSCNKKKDLEYVKAIAAKFSKLTKQSVQIYKVDKNGIITYDFEPIVRNRKNDRENVIDYIYL